MRNFKIYPIDESSLEMYKKCFDDNGSPRKIEKLRWQFLQNTESKSFVDIAFDENKNKVAAIYAMSCVRFKIENKISVATQALDSIADKDYRGLGLFVTLAKSVNLNANNSNISLVYGFPNGNSIKFYKKWLGWHFLDPVPFLFKPLKSKYFTNKINALQYLPNINLSFLSFNYSYSYKIVEKNDFPEEVNTIWHQFSKEIRIGVERDKKYLDWRYIQKPYENYKIVHCYASNNKYLGFIIYTIKEKHGGKIAYIMELLFDLEVPKSGKVLLNYAIKMIKKENADCILSWCLEHSPNYSIYKKHFFFNLPEKFRPIELHFGVKTFQENIIPLVNNRKNWYISYSDSDTV